MLYFINLHILFIFFISLNYIIPHQIFASRKKSIISGVEVKVYKKEKKHIETSALLCALFINGYSLKEIKKNLNEKGISSEIIDVYRIKPINKKEIIKILEKSKCVVSIEEQLLDGGIGSILCEIIADNKINIPIKMKKEIVTQKVASKIINI